MANKIKSNAAANEVPKEEKNNEQFTCLRCRKSFSSRASLKVHNRKHLNRESVDELKLLEQGHVPEKNKIGSEFKGKNKIIIS